MELREYWRVLRRRAWIPALLIAIAVLTTGTLSLLSKPDYTATSTVVAKGSGALSFPEVANSNTMLLAVIQQLNLPEGPDQLRTRIRVTSNSTNQFKIAVTDYDPGRAVAIANTLGKAAATKYEALAGGNKSSAADILEQQRAGFRAEYLTAAVALAGFNRQHPDAVGANSHPKDADVAATAMQLQLDERAAADDYLRFQQDLTQAKVQDLTNTRNFAASMVDEGAASADTAGRILRVFYAGALALALGIAIILALEYLDQSVREPEEVEALIGAPVIGIIPRGSPRALRAAKGRVA